MFCSKTFTVLQFLARFEADLGRNLPGYYASAAQNWPNRFHGGALSGGSHQDVLKRTDEVFNEGSQRVPASDLLIPGNDVIDEKSAFKENRP